MFLHDIPPCKNCQKRFMACHTVCEDYKKWKSDHEKRRNEILEREKIGNQILASKIEFSESYQRKTRSKKRK